MTGRLHARPWAQRPSVTAWVRLRRLLVAVALIAGVIAVPIPAHAAGPAASVTFTDAPSYVALDGRVTLSGTVRNTGTVPLFTVQVLTWRDPSPITSRTALTAALARDPNAATGTRIVDEGAFVNIGSPGAPWQPGETASFTVSATVTQLGLTTAGVYLVGVHVRASTDGSASYQTYGRGRTLLPVTRTGAPVGPVAPVATVVWLSSKPSLLRPSVTSGATVLAQATFRDDHLAGELTGRLGALLEAAAAESAAYAIDPALYREVAEMAAGYEVRQGPTTTTGAGRAAAQAWLARFATLPPERGYRLPYGNPDLALGAATNDAGMLDRATAALVDVPAVAGLPLLVRSPDGAADGRFLGYVARLKPAVVLAHTRSGPVGLSSVAGTVVATESVTANAGPGPDDPTTALQVRQRQLADSYVAALDGAGSVRVMSDAADVAATTGPLPPWQSRTPLASIVPTGQWSEGVGTGTPAGRLSTATVTVVTTLATSLARYGDLTAAPVDAARVAARALSPVVSQDWADDAEAAAYALDATSPYAGAFDAVRLRVAKKVTMTSHTNQFPVTVSNSLSAPIVVSVRFTTSNAGRLSVPDTLPISVAAGESVTVNVSPQATLNGEVDVVAQIVTQAGAAVGEPEKFIIEATEVGRVAWVIVILSGLVLAVATVLRIRQVARDGRGRS